jgi:hypothetical protein
MSKFTFVCEEESMPWSTSVESKHTLEFKAELLDDVIKEFEMFLRGCGFNIEGELQVVDNNAD